MWTAHYTTLLCALAAALLGCPAYEDALSGTYRRAAEGEEPMAIEVFRQGDYVTALVRTYRVARDEPFRDELSCQWSELGAPLNTQDLSFTLRLPRLRAQAEEQLIEGRFLDERRLSIKLNGGLPRLFERYSDTPVGRCEQPPELLLHADFSASNNTLDPALHTLRRPVFSLLWLGVEPVQQADTIFWVGLSRLSSSFYLTERHFLPASNSLTSSITLTIPPPEARDLVQSGSTRYALAHLVVIDDLLECPAPPALCAPPDRLSWNIAQEPIVATSSTPLPPDQPDDATTVTRALLYVEGDLNELSPSLLARFTNLQEYRELGLTDEHFYLVELRHDLDSVLRLTLPTDPLNRRVRLRLNTRHLDASDILLPRLFPF